MRTLAFLLILLIASQPNSWAMGMIVSADNSNDIHDNSNSPLHHSQTSVAETIAGDYAVDVDAQVFGHADCDESQIDCLMKCLAFCSGTTELPAFTELFSSRQFESFLFEVSPTGITSRPTSPEIRPPRYI